MASRKILLLPSSFLFSRVKLLDIAGIRLLSYQSSSLSQGIKKSYAEDTAAGSPIFKLEESLKLDAGQTGFIKGTLPGENSSSTIVKRKVFIYDPEKHGSFFSDDFSGNLAFRPPECLWLPAIEIIEKIYNEYSNDPDKNCPKNLAFKYGMGENTVRSFIKAGKEAITDVEFRLAFEELPQSLQEELEEAASSYKASFSVHYVENLRGYKRPPLESQNEFFSNGNYIATEPLFVQVGKNVPAFIISEEESVEKLNKEIAKEKIPPVRNKLDEELKHVVFGPGSNKKSSQRTLSKGPMRLLFMDTSKPTREEKRKSIKAYVADSKTLRSATEHEEEYFASRFLHCNRSRLLF